MSAPVPAPVLIPVVSLYVRLFALLAADVAACGACADLPAGSYCLSHVCLDCSGPGFMAHPHGVGCV